MREVTLKIPSRREIKDFARRFKTGIRFMKKDAVQEWVDIIERQNESWSGAPFSNTENLVYQHNFHIWVYRCTQVISDSGMRVNWYLEREYLKGGKRKNEPLPLDHDAARLLEDPNPRESGIDLREQIFINLQLTGMFFLYYENDELMLLRSDRMKIHPGRAYPTIKGYSFQLGGQWKPLDPDDIIYGKYYNPANEYVGLPPMTPAKNSIKQYLSAQRFNLNFFENHANPMGILKSDYPFASVEETEPYRLQWEKLFKGYENFGKVAIMGHGLDFKPVTETHSDMSYTELLKYTRDEIAAAFGVPSIYLNDTEKANYANLRAHEQMLWRSKMIPDLQKIGAVFDKFFNRKFPEKNSKIHLRWNLNEVEALQEDIEKEARASKHLVLSGQRLVNEQRALRGESALPGGDVTLVPANYVPLEMAGTAVGSNVPVKALTTKDAVEFEGSLLPTTEARRRHWMITKDIIISIQDKMTRLLSAMFRDWEREMKQNLRGMDEAFYEKDYDIGDEDEILFDIEEAMKKAEKIAIAIFVAAMLKGGQRMSRIIADMTGEPEIPFSIRDPRVSEYMKRATQRFKESIAGRNWELMKDSLNEGIRNSETQAELARRVEANMGRAISNAKTIARTEVLPRYHEAQLTAMKASKRVRQKEWLCAFVRLSRGGHQTADGQKVDIDGYFIVTSDEGVTDYLEYPGAPNGDRSNIINCLCDFSPVPVQDEEIVQGG